MTQKNKQKIVDLLFDFLIDQMRLTENTTAQKVKVGMLDEVEYFLKRFGEKKTFNENLVMVAFVMGINFVHNNTPKEEDAGDWWKKENE